MRQIDALRSRVEALTDGEIHKILREQKEFRATKHEVFDLEIKGERYRFDVAALNAHIDADQSIGSIVALVLDEDMQENIFTAREVVFERVVALCFNPDRSYLTRYLTVVEVDGEHVMIDGANRIAVRCLAGAKEAYSRLIPETVWRQFLLPLDGGGIYKPWEDR